MNAFISIVFLFIIAYIYVKTISYLYDTFLWKSKYSAIQLYAAFKEYYELMIGNEEYEACKDVTDILNKLEKGKVPKAIKNYDIKEKSKTYEVCGLIVTEIELSINN